MKVLVVNKYLFNKGGSETYILNLFEYMGKLRHKIEYFGMTDDKNIVGNKLGQSVSGLDFKGSMLKKILYPFKIVYSFEAKIKIGRIIRSFKPDIIHLNNYNYQITPSILYEIKKYGLPVVQTLHDPQLVCPYHRLYNYRTKAICEKCSGGKFYNCLLERCMDKSVLKSALGTAESYIYKLFKIYNTIDYFISPSRFLKEKILEMDAGLPENKFIVLHNFAACSDSGPTTVKKPFVLYFGRISEEKGIDTLIEACKRLPDISFVIAGSGELSGKLTDVKNIRYVGHKTGEELKTLIKEALFSVCPSEWYENCPMSVIESQMCGTPVIGSDIGGIPELIEDGTDGLLFKAGDVNDLVEKINYLYNNEAILKQFSDKCSQKIKQNYSIDRYYEELMKVYSSVVQKHKVFGGG